MAAHSTMYPATKTATGAACPLAAALAYSRTTGTTAGNIIAAIIATHATRNATNDIAMAGCGSIGIPSIGMPSIGILSPAMSPALTADHHHPTPARISSACRQPDVGPARSPTNVTHSHASRPCDQL